MFVDEKTKSKAAFTRDSLKKTTINDSQGKHAKALGLWTAKGVASTSYKYQLLICNTSSTKGFMISGYTIYKGSDCYKQCDNWCYDTVSPYFRSRSKIWSGLSFNENGHKQLGKRLISVAIR